MERNEWNRIFNNELIREDFRFVCLDYKNI